MNHERAPLRIYTAIVPAKRLENAKSRLHPEGAIRRSFATAFLHDVLAVLGTHPMVGEVLVVTEDEDVMAMAHTMAAVPVRENPGAARSGLNGAIAQGLWCAFRRSPDRPIAVVPSDLVFLDGPGLTAVLTQAAGHRRAFCRDEEGTGTTILTSTTAVSLETYYGPMSAERHLRAGFEELVGMPIGARRDVDVLPTLHMAQPGEVGTHAARALAEVGPVGVLAPA